MKPFKLVMTDEENDEIGTRFIRLKYN